MLSDLSSYWKPKVYEPRHTTTREGLVDFLKALKSAVSADAYYLFEALTSIPAPDRMADALRTVIGMLQETPGPLEGQYNRSTAEVFASLMTPREYAAFYEVANRGGLSQVQKTIAEDLLCLRDRATLAHFLGRTFRSLQTHPHIPLLQEEP